MVSTVCLADPLVGIPAFRRRARGPRPMPRAESWPSGYRMNLAENDEQCDAVCRQGIDIDRHRVLGLDSHAPQNGWQGFFI